MKTINLTANFKQITYKVNVFFNPLGAGTVQFSSPDLRYGDQCTLTIVPNAGYDFSSLTEDGVELTTNLEYEFEVDSNKIFVANFDQTGEFSPLEFSDDFNI